MEPERQLFCVCASGEVVVGSRSGFLEETIDNSKDGPSRLGQLRAACAIENRIYATGMARRVYRRTAPGRWEAIDKGLFVPRSQRTDALGFDCIDGRGPDNLFAAGFGGEIWHYDGQIWVQQESPTNVARTTMRYGPDGFVYIAGLVGTLLRGRLGIWESIHQELTKDDFWGMTIFKGVPYFATNRAVYRLQGAYLEPVDFGSLGKITTGRLDCDSEVMWSVGSKHLAVTRDGKIWEAVPGPS